MKMVFKSGEEIQQLIKELEALVEVAKGISDEEAIAYLEELVPRLGEIRIARLLLGSERLVSMREALEDIKAVRAHPLRNLAFLPGLGGLRDRMTLAQTDLWAAKMSLAWRKLQSKGDEKPC